jgi:hypothetical protein
MSTPGAASTNAIRTPLHTCFAFLIRRINDRVWKEQVCLFFFLAFWIFIPFTAAFLFCETYIQIISRPVFCFACWAQTTRLFTQCVSLSHKLCVRSKCGGRLYRAKINYRRRARHQHRRPEQRESARLGAHGRRGGWMDITLSPSPPASTKVKFRFVHIRT